MIDKERLEKLIKEKATIYEAKYGKVIEVDLSKVKDYFMSKDYIKLNEFPTYYLTRKRYNHLFEYKNDSEWFAKFGNITRTETLVLPTWEEFKTMKEPHFDFFTIKDGIPFKYVCEADVGYRQRKPIGLAVMFKEYGEKGYDIIYQAEKFDKRNYIKACELCRKLFLGEEIE